MKKLLFAVVLAICSFSISYADTPEELVKAAEEAKGQERAIAYKKLGDLYAGAEDYKKAGEAYIDALKYGRDSFTRDERKRMATVISWGGFFEEAAGELRAIISENPEDLEARVAYARVLSWTGRLEEALDELNPVLDKYPKDRDALLLKADILRWKGENKKAREIYDSLLSDKEDFGARSGRIYTDLSGREFREAKKDLKLLKPSNAYEEKQLKEITEAVSSATRPDLDISFKYYNDSDFNQSRRYSAKYGFLIGDYRLNAGYLHTDAGDRFRNNGADSFSAGVDAKLSEKIRGGAGVGLTLLSNRDHSVFPNLFLKADTKISNMDVTASISRDTLTDTAALIENGIRFTSYSLYLTRPLNKLTLRGWYSYRRYSDDNSAHDVQINPEYPLMYKDIKIKAGYRLRYLDYQRQSLGGYYDPDWYISNQLYANLSWEEDKLYIIMEPNGGYQSSRRFGGSNNGFFGGGAITAGYKLYKSLRFEADAEGGNSSIGTVAGFRYYQTGLKVIFMP